MYLLLVGVYHYKVNRKKKERKVMQRQVSYQVLAKNIQLPQTLQFGNFTQVILSSILPPN